MPVSDPYSPPLSRGVGDQPAAHVCSARDHATDCPGAGPPVARRTLLRAGASLALPAPAGCLGGQSGTTADPVALSGGLSCDVCGMIVENHPGPVGQLHFGSNTPSGHANPARFDSLKQCLFPYRFEREALGWTVRAAYLTDYSAVDYTVSGDGPFISSHVEAGAFAPAASLSYVVGSEVQGAMGPDFVPFSATADAEAFASEYGGTVVAHGDIDERLVGR